MDIQTKEPPKIEEKKCCLPCCSCSGWKVIVCVIVGLMVVAGAVYAGYFLGRKSLSPRELLIPPKPITTQIPIDNGPVKIEVSPTPDPTTDWKTYTSSVYRFSVKYPEQYVPRDVGRGITTFYDISKGSEVKKIDIYKDFQGGWGCVVKISSEKIFVDGREEELFVQAGALAENNCTAEDPNSSRAGILIIKRQDLFWLFELTINRNNETEEISTFKKILSTFKSLD